MKIRVSYSRLLSGLGYNNQSAEAEIEFEVPSNIAETLDEAYRWAWEKVRSEVNKQLGIEIEGDPIPF